MGEHGISTERDDARLRDFVKALLEDVRALERMLAEDMIESGVRRIGAEQEFFLVDSSFQPANVATEVLGRLGDGRFTTELGRFNFEANLTPLELGGDCLTRMEGELATLTERAREAARAEGARVALCGILPTLAKRHLGLESMTPKERYAQLNRTMIELRGGEFKTLIKGVDELRTTHDNVMLEACNTSFQIHFQVGSGEFARLYNLAQLVTAPVLAAAVNSPVLLQRRLWHETRVALFQQSLDTRSETHAQRGSRQRVTFGSAWVQDSVLEIFREDIARFRALIAIDVDGSPLAALDRGEVPALRALCLHNGTVYRWNRPCYGTTAGRPHLRIENRVLPAGPTITDEFANAAFYFGLMCALDGEYGDVRKVMAFDDAKANFLAAARYGLKARFTWTGGAVVNADELILRTLLPLAERGLIERGLDRADVERYLGILRARVESGRTGAQWALDSLAGMNGNGRADERFRALAAAMVANQENGRCVHEWPAAELEQDTTERDAYHTVGQVMTSDIFSVHPEDIVDLAASLMEWEHIRHVPVEDREGRLVGLVSHRALLRMLARDAQGGGRPIAVREVMRADPVTATPETTTLEAIELMRAHKVGCLPVVQGDKLVGIVTERDFIEVSARLLDRWLRDG